MKTNRSIPSAIVIPVLTVEDPAAAAAFYVDAFGFAERLRIPPNHRIQMNVDGGGAVIVADVRHQKVPPHDGEVTVSVLLRVEDAAAHCERARAAGATILREPTDWEYGERQYEAVDPFGHHWVFSETREDVDPASWSGELVSD
jgi:uncharacterized glyoxalase superfamily protein PhnB